jgi:hypothetical protein
MSADRSAAQSYRKRPLVVEAMQFDGKNGATIAVWSGERARPVVELHAPMVMAIYTLEGVMRADVGDWIIRGVKGEFYPCKPDIFEETYEAAE